VTKTIFICALAVFSNFALGDDVLNGDVLQRHLKFGEVTRVFFLTGGEMAGNVDVYCDGDDVNRSKYIEYQRINAKSGLGTGVTISHKSTLTFTLDKTPNAISVAYPRAKLISVMCE